MITAIAMKAIRSVHPHCAMVAPPGSVMTFIGSPNRQLGRSLIGVFKISHDFSIQQKPGSAARETVLTVCLSRNVVVGYHAHICGKSGGHTATSAGQRRRSSTTRNRRAIVSSNLTQRIVIPVGKTCPKASQRWQNDDHNTRQWRKARLRNGQDPLARHSVCFPCPGRLERSEGDPG
jgi:hypothetical protein